MSSSSWLHLLKLWSLRQTRRGSDLYWSQGDRLDSKQLVSGQGPLLARRDMSFAFRTAAELFRIIPDEQVPVIVPWGDAMRLAREIERLGPTRERVRAVQRYAVGVYRATLAKLVSASAVREIVEGLGLFVLDSPRLYSELWGLDDGDAGLFAPEDLVA